jgi:ATP-dependent DNA ligase
MAGIVKRMAKRRSTRKLQTIGLLSDLNEPLKSPAPKPCDKAQPRLPLDPMPVRIEPQLATLVAKPLLRSACAHGLGGIIAKNRDKPYRSGRSTDWLKIKCTNSESFAVIGYEPSVKVRGSIASLLLAARKGDDLVYVGNVGTGFSAKLAHELKVQLDGMRVSEPAAIGIEGKKYIFVEPKLVAEVTFGAWTHDGKLRHTSFKGLRNIADETANLAKSNLNHTQADRLARST